MKIGVIVEGKSDKTFLNTVLPKEVNCDYFIIQSSEKKNKCDILNPKVIKERIETCQARGCQKVYILVDLNTQCTYERQYDCLLELRRDYETKISIHLFQNVNIIVVEREIESWMGSHWKVSTNMTKSDLNRLMQKEFNVRHDLSEEDMVKRFLANKKSVNREHNRSLKHFLSKLESICRAS